MAETLERVQAGDRDPHCLKCGGILKSATVSFGQPLDLRVLARAQAAADTAEVLLVAGSSLAVQPAASLVPRARRSGARVVIANAQPTPFDSIASVVLRDPLSHVLPALVRRE